MAITNIGLREFALGEFAALGWPGDDERQRVVCDNLIELLTVFSRQGHSGFTAPYVLRLFDSLARFEPISPLTGEEQEWEPIGDNLWQNKRCFHVFRDPSGAYDIEGRVFVESSGRQFTGHESRVPVTFPYTPKIEFVKVER